MSDRNNQTVVVHGGAPLLRSTLALALTGAGDRLAGAEAGDRPALEAALTSAVAPVAVLFLVTGLGASSLAEITDVVSLAGAVPVIVVTPSASIDGVTRVLDAGAKGVVPHDETVRELTAAVGFVADGGIYIPAGALTATDGGWTHGAADGAESGAAARLPTLTDRQRQIVEHVAAGMSNREIAQSLDIREGTVKVHVARILEKLGVANRLEAALAVAESRTRNGGADADRGPAGMAGLRAARRR
jgi:DNA-binding NarL/FixJ family response regulator